VEHYRESKRRFPRIGSRCESCSLGEVIIKACNPLRDTVTVIKENKLVDIPLSDLKRADGSVSREEPEPVVEEVEDEVVDEIIENGDPY
jgi:hypothetical protein